MKDVLFLHLLMNARYLEKINRSPAGHGCKVLFLPLGSSQSASTVKIGFVNPGNLDSCSIAVFMQYKTRSGSMAAWHSSCGTATCRGGAKHEHNTPSTRISPLWVSGAYAPTRHTRRKEWTVRVSPLPSWSSSPGRISHALDQIHLSLRLAAFPAQRFWHTEMAESCTGARCERRRKKC